MNRYVFTRANVAAAKKHLRDKTKPAPSFLKKFAGELRGSSLFLQGKRVIIKEKIDPFLRALLYRGNTPLTRDAAYAWVTRSIAGISRAAIDSFINKQPAIRENDAQQATTKNRKKRQVKTKGQLHLDLVEVKFSDLDGVPHVRTSQRGVNTPNLPKPSGDVKKGYFMGMVDAITGLSYFHFIEKKSHDWVTPVVRAAIKWFAKELGVPAGKMTIYSDAGAEFAWKKYERDFGVGKTVIVGRDPYIEARNSFFQRCLIRAATMRASDNIYKLGDLATQQMNRTRTRTTGKIPLLAAKEGKGALAKLYNRKRGKDSGGKIRRRALEVGERVRIQLIPAGKKKMDYKAYKKIMWSKATYKVKEKRGNRYIVSGKLRHRDELKPTPPPDMESEKIIRAR